MEQEGRAIPSNLSLFLILLICIALDIVDIIELSRLKDSWNGSMGLNPEYFQECARNELIIKTAFSGFSFAAALSATTVVCFLLFYPEVFLKKIMKGFINMNYLIFGLYMMGFTLYFIINWKKYSYICDPLIPGEKYLSMVNCFSMIGCLILSVIVSFGYIIYQTIDVYSNSINKNEQSIELLRKAFWWAVFKSRRDNQRPQGDNNNQNNNNNNNIQNNNPPVEQNPNNLIDENDNENQNLI